MLFISLAVLSVAASFPYSQDQNGKKQTKYDKWQPAANRISNPVTGAVGYLLQKYHVRFFSFSETAQF